MQLKILKIDLKTCLDESRINEEKYVYQYPELDGDNKKFTKQVEQAISVEENQEKKEEIKVKQVTDEEVKKENKLLVILASIFVGLVVIVAALVLFLPKILQRQ